jgi:hypothetical protein
VAAQAQRHVIVYRSGSFVQQPPFLFPEINGPAGVEEGLGGPQLALAQGTGTRCPAETIELLTVNAEEKADVVPSENGAKDFIELEERVVIATPSLWLSGIAYPLDCARGLCSTSNSSPPRYSEPAALNATMTWKGNTIGP